ncbi:MAG: oxalurate catabolism protein HpxZ [Beijerinckiaceae bacterium]
MIVNDPETKKEVERAFARYERALVTNDVEALDAFFWNDPLAIRYGGGENLYGYEAIAAFRAARSPAGLMRSLEKTVVTTFGTDFATASTLFRRSNAPGAIGRQMQTWVRTPAGWKIVAAHVSTIPEQEEGS